MLWPAILLATPTYSTEATSKVQSNQLEAIVASSYFYYENIQINRIHSGRWLVPRRSHLRVRLSGH